MGWRGDEVARRCIDDQLQLSSDEVAAKPEDRGSERDLVC